MTKKRHGQYGTRLYHIWSNMEQRCSNPKYREFYNYGGRGITVCGEWENFLAFYEWALSSGYDDKLSIERIDNDGNYEPSNCRWATRREQSLNRRSNRFYEYEGKRLSLTEWANEKQIPFSTLWNRLNKGWSIDEALTLAHNRGNNQKLRARKKS